MSAAQAASSGNSDVGGRGSQSGVTALAAEAIDPSTLEDAQGNASSRTGAGATAAAEEDTEDSLTATTASLQPRLQTESFIAPFSTGAARGDEEKALGSASTERREGGKGKQEDDGTIWVDFEPGDPENPFNFSRTRKWTVTILAILFTSEVAATAGAYVPGIPSLERDLNVTNHELSLLGISVYPLGFALPPLFLAPFSEVFGRNVIYLSTYLVYTVLFIGIGRAENMATVIILRFLQGAMGSTGSTMVGGTLADIFKTSERGGPMALFATSAIFGTGFGPFWAGFVEGNSSLGWRWIQYIQAIYTGGIFFIFALLLKETRGSVLLTRRAARLRKETGDQRYKARAEAERASLAILIRNSLSRPLWLLVSEPIVTSFSIWVSFLWGFMYMLLESIGLIAGQHNYTPGQVGLVFLSICLAAVIGNLLNPIQEKLYQKNFPTRGPEARLYFAMLGAICFPVGCFIYGWTSFPDVNMAGPIVGIVLLMFGVYVIYLAVFNYLSDSYLIYASSALAAQSFLRNAFGFAFPLFVTQMYNNLGYQWSSSLAGFLGLALGIVPFILFAYGPRIRARSKFSLELQKLSQES